MIWQDAVIGAVQVGFLIALIPALSSKVGKPPIFTSATTAAGLFTIGATMSTFGLWFSVATAFINSGLWITLAVQQRKRSLQK